MSKNIYINRLSAALTAAKLAAIKQAIVTIETNLDFLIALTPKERQSLPKMAAGNKPFVDDVAAFVKNGKDYFPKHVQSAEFEKDLELFNQLDTFSAGLEMLSRKVTDTQTLAGHEALSAGLRFYDGVKNAEVDGDPDATPVVQRLASRFDGQGNFKGEEETPPTE
jgi:ABC-type transporter Mla subunit MlaD